VELWIYNMKNLSKAND